MGQKDIVEKSLEDYNDVFSDIVNGLVFDGKRTVKSRELKSFKVRSQYKADKGSLHEEERDNAKYWSAGNVKIAILGLENQTAPDKDMPFRIIGYDGAAYRSQLLDKKSKGRCPVLSIVLYFGESRWSGPRSIKEMVEIPEGLEEYVNDYKLHIFEIAYLTEDQGKLFRSDFRIVADYFVQKRKNKKYVPSRRTIKHVDAVLKFMSVMTGDERFLEAQKVKTTGGEPNMCEILDQVENRGIQKGIKLMQGENDTLRAERDAALAEKAAALTEKDAALTEKDAALTELVQTEADLARAMELLKKHHIAFA